MRRDLTVSLDTLPFKHVLRAGRSAMVRKKNDEFSRNELVILLDGSNAHMSFEEVVAGFPEEQVDMRPPLTPYSFWHFIEHIRIAQWDILEFIRNPDHVSPEYPMGYRPLMTEKGSPDKWRRTVRAVLNDLEELKGMALDPASDLFAPLPHAPDYSIFQELLTVAAHNSYHIGELAVLRQVTGLWPKGMEYLTGN